MAPPFATDPASPWLYFALGALSATVGVVLTYHWTRSRKRNRGLEEQVELEHGATPGKETGQGDDEMPRVDRMGLSRKAEDVLETVMEAPMLQNELPDELDVSKATVSNAVSELGDRGLVKRKKKANTYLVEPRMDAIEEESSSSAF